MIYRPNCIRIENTKMTANRQKIQIQNGFALVLALSLMSFVVLLCLSLVTLLRVEINSANVQSSQLSARMNALLGLQLALDQLQRTAGPDQRVTATAELYSNSTIDNQGHWTGVWNVENHDPLTEFIPATGPIWLVSGENPDPDVASTMSVTLLEDVANAENEVVAELVPIDDLTVSQTTGHYAYWIGDEGVKAKVNLIDPYRSVSGQTDTNYHFSQMTGQRTGVEKIRLSDLASDPSTVSDYLDPFDTTTESQIERLSNLSQVSAIDSELSHLPANRIHDLTTASYGVLANVAEGGLKKDLSLAFEMDLDDFNADSTFAAGGESLPAGHKGTIGGHELQYLFTHDYTQDGDGIRGPTWHLLRNYYRLYLQDDPDRLVDYKTYQPKGVVWDGSQYSIEARPFFPQSPDGTSSANYNIGGALYDIQLGYDINRSNFYYNGGLQRIPRPTDMQIHPVLTRFQLFLSLQAVKVYDDATESSFHYRVDLLASPLITIWNPYNVALNFDEFKVQWRFLILPIEVEYQEPGGPLQSFTLKLAYVNDGADGSLDSDDASLVCVLKGQTLEPGQVKVFSHVTATDNSSTGLEATLEPYSGSVESEVEFFRFERIKVTEGEGTYTVEELLIEPGSKLRFHGESGGGDIGGYDDRLYVRTDLKWGSHAFINTSIGTFRNPTAVREFYWPEEDPTYYGLVEEIANTTSPYRHPLGLVDTYLKPTGAIDMDHPVQFLARYNPRAISPVRITGGYNNGYDFPLIGNWSYNIKPFTDWSSSYVPVNASNGNSYWGWDNMNGTEHVVLFELPTAPLQSLAALQHVNNISRYAQEPAYVIGNSYANPFIPPKQAVETIMDAYTQVDWSYFSNRALWDDYFFSSLTPREDLSQDFESALGGYMDGAPLPDSRMVINLNSLEGISNDLVDTNSDSKIAADAYLKSAEHLLVDGAFNVNSTSVEAWKALLASTNGIEVAYQNLNSLTSAAAQSSPFSRMTLPGGDSADAWRGFRSLSDQHISDLAEAIVEQVKLRGPFVSLADFVNRRLTDDDTGLMGPLQAAIDATNINSDFSEVVTESDLSSSNIPYPKQATGATHLLLLRGTLCRVIF
ncbi:hypothetical protein SH580_03495 [Coraliomargarita algicola]|uniref:Uncharacterized protein n=1 Tax=Coraliomargarita algicola TaxID=3092156 RepID=A0ABZ0RUY4_9BACT|nr:hypothetical protein [Coraliomargarita sp. J2-16]WPJ96769.1 hypothetical protein SH580_03495 [Coraliomargarita sp. J2-16]